MVRKAEPAHRQIALHYQELIRAGALKPGDQMPSISTIRSEWGVAMSTAGRAVALLRDNGWIKTGHGRPTTVIGVPCE
jgi:DNA-binding GntR family transcriptional regulator